MWKAQGASYGKYIASLGVGKEMAGVTYVLFSRGTTLDFLCLMPPFDDSRLCAKINKAPKREANPDTLRATLTTMHAATNQRRHSQTLYSNTLYE